MLIKNLQFQKHAKVKFKRKKQKEGRDPNFQSNICWTLSSISTNEMKTKIAEADQNSIIFY